MEALWLPTWMQVRIHLCYMTQRLTIKGKAKPEFLYDNADDCVNFSIGFSLQCDFPLGNQMVPLISQFSENKPQQSDSNVYGAQLHVCLCAHILTCFSHVRLFVTLWTVAHQAPLSMGFSRQECWSGLPCPPPVNTRVQKIIPRFNEK